MDIGISSARRFIPFLRNILCVSVCNEKNTLGLLAQGMVVMDFKDSLAIISNQFVYFLRKIDSGPESYITNYTESTNSSIGLNNKYNVVMSTSFNMDICICSI